MEVFSKEMAETLPPHWSTTHPFDCEPSCNLPYGWIYNQFELELRTKKANIMGNQTHGFILRLSLVTAAPIVFAQKKDGRLRLPVHHRALNLATVKNWYAHPFISELFDHVCVGRTFTKLHLHVPYNLILTKDGDKYTMAFRTCYGKFEHRVMPLGLTNAPATSQSDTDVCLGPDIDDFVVCYLHKMVIYSANTTDCTEHERQMLQ